MNSLHFLNMSDRLNDFIENLLSDWTHTGGGHEILEILTGVWGLSGINITLSQQLQKTAAPSC